MTIMPSLVEIAKLESGAELVIMESVEEPVMRRLKSGTVVLSRTASIFSRHEKEVE